MRKRREETRGAGPEVHRFSIALHSLRANDSGQPLGLSPNRRGFSCRNVFGGVKKEPLSRGPPKLIGIAARLLLASAPLPSEIESSLAPIKKSISWARNRSNHWTN